MSTAPRTSRQSIEAISKRVASAGYPFARVTPRGNRDLGNHTIGVEYLVDQGERAYVERIEIRGNTRTRDYVIRREFDMSEGDAFNQEMITTAKRRLDALGYFSSVNITTAAGQRVRTASSLSSMLQDQSTGSFGIGAGYAAGSDGGLLLEASIEEKNFLGRGQYIRIAAGGGTEGIRTYNISFTEPYFLGYRLAAGFDIFKNETLERRQLRLSEDRLLAARDRADHRRPGDDVPLQLQADGLRRQRRSGSDLSAPYHESCRRTARGCSRRFRRR